MTTRIVLVAAAAASLATPVFAADMPTKAPIAPVAAPLTWTGWYVGLNVGIIDPFHSIVTTNGTVLETSTFPPNATGLASAVTSDLGHGNSNLGIIGGGQIGYNFQWTPAILIGFETDIQATSLREHNNINNLVFVNSAAGTWTATVNGTRDLEWLGTVRGRIGLTTIPNWLFYATGGFAYGGVKSSTSIVAGGVTGFPPAQAIAGSFSETRTGWTVGGGAEWLLAQNWSAKFEYLYYDLGTANYSNGVVSFNMGPTPFPGVLNATVSSTSSVEFKGQIFRLGLNYKFY